MICENSVVVAIHNLFAGAFPHFRCVACWDEFSIRCWVSLKVAGAMISKLVQKNHDHRDFCEPELVSLQQNLIETPTINA
jgi:hypothetical protein